MKLVIFGLTLSSSWGNGHATLWRGLCRALVRAGHEVVFFERNVPYYAAHRDLHQIEGGELVLYADWAEGRTAALRHLGTADVGMITSYCPDALAAGELMVEANVPLRTFYDLDTPVTLSALRAGRPVAYLGPRGLADFDLVLSYTGGRALDDLRTLLGARRVAPLYGSVDPDVHGPRAVAPSFRADLSYLGTYAADRQETLEHLFVAPARALPGRRFLIAGAQYPQDFPWTGNIYFLQHLAPAQHAAFYASSGATLNVTRAPMKAMGYCPSGRLFEAAACGTPIISDGWHGLDTFFQPGEEIVVAAETGDVVAALELPADQLRALGQRARERVLARHTAAHRAAELLDLLGHRTRAQPALTA